MAAILETPQYVAYQKNVVYAFIKLSAKSHSFNILCTMDGLSCPSIVNDLTALFLYNSVLVQEHICSEWSDGKTSVQILSITERIKVYSN